MAMFMSITGCGGVPEEASGTPVPETYQEDQMKAQKAAQEAAMKNAKKR
ncbi:MAG: hypothetical protein WBH28_01455 [Fuerstiella sp.]